MATPPSSAFAAGPAGTVHIYDGPLTRLEVRPRTFGRFDFAPMDRAEPLAGPLNRFVDDCSRRPGDIAVVVRSRRVALEVSIAVARDAEGAWTMSDTLADPDAGRATDRDGVARRLAELFADVPAG